MIFQLITLVDITQTNARRGHEIFEQKQQQNFLTVLQTLSLRSNAIVNHEPKSFFDDAEHYGFGEHYHGRQQLWKLNFSYESSVENILDLIVDDLNYVPFIPNLNESVFFDIPVFQTKDIKLKNTIVIPIENNY
jgi:hypothetical protein